MTRPWSDWFEEAWAQREETIYPSLFGELGEGIFTLDADVFSKSFRQTEIDPRWLRLGVFESPPNAHHASWLYVSSGLSNAWDDEQPDPESASGLGCEFVFESTVRGDWAIRLVQNLVAYQILLSCGRYPGQPLLGLHDRIPVGGALPVPGSKITKLMLVEPEPLLDSFRILSGRVTLLRIAGITEDEARFAKERGGDELLPLLHAADAIPITDPLRESVLS